ncbi:hypothetical protein CcaCcLH18_13156 [Colletotrichum camelliae]|nr:hypothetical protein CcaCcLH18_13156 [Colletotrichum camelliae]
MATPRRSHDHYVDEVSSLEDTPIGYHLPIEQPEYPEPQTAVEDEPPQRTSSEQEGKSIHTLHSCKEEEAFLPTRRRPWSIGQHHWILETSAAVLSILSFIGISMILFSYKDKPLISWSFFLSLNTVVSIFGAISRASIGLAIGACVSQGKWNWYKRAEDNIMVFDRFDEASRGLWGSLRLLWWSRLRHWVAIGALSTVMLIGFQPFLQAVITFEGEEVDLSGGNVIASIGRSQRLDTGKLIWIGDGGLYNIKLPDGSRLALTSVRMQYGYGPNAAINRGFSNTGTLESEKPDFFCSSGNCTWPPHASLAVCSDCRDISNHLVRTTGRADRKQKVVTIPHTINNIDWGPEKRPFTKFELRDLNMNISNFDDRKDAVYQTEMTAKATCQPGNTISFRDSKALLISFAIIQASQGFRDSSEEWADSNVTALECGLSLCTNAYQAVVEKGILTERLLASHSIRNLESFLTTGALNTLEKSRLYNEMKNFTLDTGRSDFTRSDLQLLFPREELARITGDNSEEGWKFNISHAATTIMTTVLTGFGIRGGATVNDQLVYPIVEDDYDQPSVIRSLGESNNLKTTFGLAAASLTKWIREPAQKAEMVSGVTKEWVIYIRVRWAFLSLPIAGLLGGLTFCILSVWETSRLKMEPWKGSALAGLAHGLDSNARDRLRAAHEVYRMDEHARATKVQFVDSGHGPQLSSEGSDRGIADESDIQGRPR